DCIDGKPYKYAVNDLCLIPDTAVLDPRLTISLPSSMTADTGMDALT
ncbi:MAG TPA: alcohol dehydrogenase, partial [Lachnospiraceae bacterium]|nr:alcohol dehydrogenase [Lachnospiraceae bacterium]